MIAIPVALSKTSLRPSGDQSGWPPRVTARAWPVRTSTLSTFSVPCEFGLFEAGHSIVLARPCREHDDRDIAAIGPGPEDPADLDAVQHGEVEIQNDEIGRPVGDRLQGLIAAVDDVRLRLSGSLKRMLDESRNVVFVFNDQYPVSLHP